MSNEVIVDEKSKKVDDKKKDRKTELYGDNQQKIFDEIIVLLNNLKPDDTSSYIDAPDIEKNKDKIMKYEEDLHRYFPCVTWQRYIKVKENKHMSLIRYILKQFYYTLTYKQIIQKKDGGVFSFYRYYLKSI